MRTGSRRLACTFLASTMLMTGTMARAQDTSSGEPAGTQANSQEPSDVEEIIVTAQRRAENLQDVPVAITAITTKTLDDLQVDSFDDYAKLVPSLSFKSAGPGSANVYFRGVASGENANHSASLPSVGTYLDEQPITTIQGALDIHVFDIARVEALAGPQGTLYGASSQAGTVRIITNKPDTSATYGEMAVELNKVAHGDFGGTAEAFVNLPISDRAATRIVGWYRRDGGYIDNIAGTMTFPILQSVNDELVDLPGDDITISNADLAEDDYNDVETYGARAALRLELNESWTVTPQLMAQKQLSHGSFQVESGLGDLETMQFNPERFDDRWYQAALTVEGKIADFDITYAGSYMKRRVEGQLDYSDYAYFYDAISGYGRFFYDNDYNQVSPNQYIQSDDRFQKLSQELRFTSPADRPIRLVGGVFYQRQQHDILQNYIVDDIADFIKVPGTESNIWLTDQIRVDRDYGLFGELSYDITPRFTVTGGGRLYKFKNSLVGFFGYNSYLDADGLGFSGNPIYNCELFGPPTVGGPCNNVDKTTKGSGFLHRLNGTYKVADDTIVYATWSKGYRPGGINRRGTLPPYSADFITNYELGAKIGIGRGAHLNLAAYQLDWTDIQLSFLGANGLTEIRNAGNARIRGLEADLLLRPAAGLTLSLGAAYNDANLRNAFCRFSNPDNDCTIDVDLNGNGVIEPDEGEENAQLAPNGTRLPLTAKLKVNGRARYEWPMFGDGRAHVQGTWTYEGARRRDLRIYQNSIYGNMDAYHLFDASAGVERGQWGVDLYVKNLFDERGEISKSIQCAEAVCGDPDGVTDIGGKIYTTVSRPRTIGLRVSRKF